MPTYEFQCAKCGERFTVVRPISSGGAPACPKCASRHTRQLPSAFYAKTVRKS